ncbi:MAG: hypothetical protein ACREGB_00785, partial [Candidatus Saccharimonadales bacterium]
MGKNLKKREPLVALDPVAFAAIKALEDKDNEAENQTEKAEQNNSQSGMLGLILKSLKTQDSERVQRLAFEVDPLSQTSPYGSLYKAKINLVPDHIIKRITGPQGDELVCQILQARSNLLASFGRPRSSRFSVGFQFDELNGSKVPEDDEKYEALKTRMEKMTEILWNCGFKGLEEDSHPNLSQFLKMITRDGLAYGRFAVEFIKAIDKGTGKEYIHSFRAVDVGTIFRIVPQKEKDQSTRTEALRLLQKLKDKDFSIDIERYKEDEYKWVQVMDGRPSQVFTDEELVVYNLYPVTNVEYNGYPLTPLDQSLSAVTTHINITIHNRLYFQNGRAARGMLVFNSDTMDEGSVQKIRLQFHQSINSVQNSWRMPVFVVPTEDKVSWQTIDMQGRDAEFQYLMDNNSRVILSAFQMSPEELPGYAHLARGTNTQALAESDNEWKLTAARDVGLRPLMYDIQDFLNTHVLPKFDHDLSKSHQLVLAGLEKDSPEKEATRLQQDMGIHLTFDDIMEQVEKKKIGKELGGQFPLNPQFKQQVIDPYFT